ncbi:MAG: trypsin-like peptidase domain-containing protein [Planctomycetaceae bacterium]|nr:trypsin-like peptidase domain-containing protein [Planctomycetaceae bacterium]
MNTSLCHAVLKSPALIGCWALLFLCSGCQDQGGDLPPVTNANQNTGGSVNPGPPIQPADQMLGNAPTPASAPTPDSAKKEFQLTARTDLFGSTISILDGATSEVIEEFTLTKGELTHEFTIPREKTVVVQANAFGHVQQSAPVQLTKNEEVSVEFDLLGEADFRELIKSATCLVRIPDGGFGSGFLYGDRQTIVTAAHCVAAKNVGDLKYTFYPDESREVTYENARLLFYDQKQDVAVLRLAEPVSEEHYWLWSGGSAAQGDEVLVMGNPGRNGEYDPMYARSCKVAAVRPDELRLDVEIYPGYSGGPVVRSGTTQVLGVVSYKIIQSDNYEQVGYSFARSSDIAGDAFTQWINLSEELQEGHITRVEDRYSREFGRNLAHNAAIAYYGDSAVYTIICISLLQDYKIHMIRKLAELPPLTLSQRRLVLKKAHEEYLKDIAPDIAEKVRERVSPKLRGTHLDSEHKLIMEDESVSRTVKDSLEKSRAAYLQLKEAAETIVKKKKGEDRTAEEFEMFILELWGDVRFNAEEVITATAPR